MSFFRSFSRIHLSTAIVVMFVAAFVLAANCAQVMSLMVGEPGDWNYIRTIGIPCTAAQIVRDKEGVHLLIFEFLGTCVDALCFLVLILVVAIPFERMVRSRG